jgi:hypothetical protein
VSGCLFPILQILLRLAGGARTYVDKGFNGGYVRALSGRPSKQLGLYMQTSAAVT